MTAEKKRKIARVLSFIVIIAGVTVIIGWIFNIEILKSISPSWVSMKFDTAISFLLSGIVIYSITKVQEGEFDKAQIIISITSLIIILLMGILFFSTLFRIHTGLENLFISETAGGVKTVVPGRPSIPTMINFILIAVSGILSIGNLEKVHKKLKIIGITIGIIGALAVIGYIINISFLYYYIKGVNSAMACHTAILFVLLGIGLICL
ncbi:MAG: hypothetical protein A2539_03005 [Elusimicrobia bacterium RIFOXYD2_FULL_34_15]|nr:MAG: hypothetical protein A2539_03005 [Elusimicrobia bacterium RIFOXYD2_FULL_34_15]